MDIKSKINKITCTFIDSDLEKEYKRSEWIREKSKFTYIMIALTCIGILALAIESGTKARWESTGLVYTELIEFIGGWLIFTHIFGIIF